MPKRRFWNPLKRKKYSAQTMRNRSQKTAETLLLEPTKNKEKRLRKVASSKAQRNAGKMPKRRCWNPLKRKIYICPNHAKPRQKTAETLLLDPTKNKEKTCKPPGQTQEKGVWDAHAKRQNPSRFCAQAIAKPQPKKCRNVAVGAH